MRARRFSAACLRSARVQGAPWLPTSQTVTDDSLPPGMDGMRVAFIRARKQAHCTYHIYVASGPWTPGRGGGQPARPCSRRPPPFGWTLGRAHQH